jgi:two-component system, NtrC family, nitrogen regulation response regulator GlnG
MMTRPFAGCLEKALSRAGMVTEVSSELTMCRRTCESETPAALISDIRMPGTDGFELLKARQGKVP